MACAAGRSGHFSIHAASAQRVRQRRCVMHYALLLNLPDPGSHELWVPGYTRDWYKAFGVSERAIAAPPHIRLCVDFSL